MITPHTTLAAAAAVPKALPPGAPTEDWLEENARGFAKSYAVLVTPDMAATWLEQNRDNRTFRKAHMATFAEEMRRNQWRLTHQGIAFGTTGRLLDGQHRLAAVVETGLPQLMLVFVECDESGFPNFDRGAKRGIADVLLIDNKTASIGQTLARICITYSSGTSRRSLPSEVSKVLEATAPDIEAMNQASPANRPGRTLASIRAAWLVHHHVSGENDRKVLRAQWKAFAEFDIKRMDTATESGERRLENFKAVRGGAVEVESACIGWLMFDPARRDLERVVVRHSATALDEMRAAVRTFLPDLVTVNPEASATRAAVKAAKSASPPDADKPKRWSIMADPVLGPEYRAKAGEASARKAAERRALRESA